MSKEIIGPKIKMFRKKRRITQEELAKSLGYSDKSVISHIEKGDADMTYEKILLLLRTYMLDANELFEVERIDKQLGDWRNKQSTTRKLPENIHLEILKSEDENQFIKDNQYAFKHGAKSYFSNAELEQQYEEPGEIISRETIYNSIHHNGSIAYRIIDNNKPVGGIIVNIQGSEGELEIFFVNPDAHSKGIGQAAWQEIERIHSNVKVWQTVTPCFEKRNIHFYVNKLGFHIVAYYNEHYPDKDCPEDMWEMYKFEKIMR